MPPPQAKMSQTEKAMLPEEEANPERQEWVMGSRCAKLSTGHGTAQNTGHSRGHESSMKKLVACVSQDNFSLSSEGEEEEEEDEEEEEEDEEEEEEEQIPVKGKLLLMEPEKQESIEDNAEAQPSPEPKQTHS
ncbi:protamine-3-like protein [Cricetulus griseus]|nr:protamine-3-like protein [Cricetulus griseus]